MAWNEVFDFLINHECAHLRQSVQANKVLGVLENLHIGQVVCYSVAALVPGDGASRLTAHLRPAVANPVGLGCGGGSSFRKLPRCL